MIEVMEAGPSFMAFTYCLALLPCDVIIDATAVFACTELLCCLAMVA